MKYNTFSGGVEPGGLHSKQDIKVLICYILCNVESMHKGDMIASLSEDGIANYFDSGEAFSELVSSGSVGTVINSDDEYEIKDSGKIISEQLCSSIPVSIRERAVDSARLMLKRIKNEKENKVKIEKNKFGYNIICSISGGEFDLLKFTLYAPNMEQAEKIKYNFRRDPEAIYRTVLAVLTRKEETDGKLEDMLFDFMG